MQFVVGIASFGAVYVLKGVLHIDDALDVGSVHGVPGIVGAIMIGFFASTDVNPIGSNGVFYGHGRQLWVQLVGILVVMAWTTLITVPLIVVFRRGRWFSLQPHHEALGLDQKDHHVNAYCDIGEESTAEGIPELSENDFFAV